MIMNHFNMFDTLFKGKKKRKIREVFYFFEKRFKEFRAQ